MTRGSDENTIYTLNDGLGQFRVRDMSHTGKCIRRFGGIYAYCRYFIDRKW